MSNNNDIYDVSLVPDNVFTLDGNDFYQLVQSLVGETVCEILRIQSINSTRSFLNTDDVLEIFKYDSPDLISIKNKSCHKMTNGHYIIKAGIQSSLAYLTKLLEIKQDQQQSIMNNDNNNSNEQTLPYEIINNNSMLRSLFSWYEQNENMSNSNSNSNDKQIFLSSFIDNITKNLSKPKHNYRYNESIKRFAVALFILGGKLTYEFVRMNLIAALPTIPTLNNLILNANLRVAEAEFRFDALQQHLLSIHTKLGFVSEDCTGVIRKIKYDVTTNSFVGFATPLAIGVPIAQFYQTDSY
ncbi:unnamed protein product [Didymodactylos carnosus]|uniref:THAP9-like helix-turn-helix domain-containing protein n=1 Tax=Didymodactylos carnosus TaxID=1234261 RepID=A0A8S2GSX4_9BILA|nr:unnamed protein product [Didymodactylos carnosus]CAF3554212.1 unnamed protein product [Didymodactylos carnosus]